jgi:hypothetical protein
MELLHASDTVPRQFKLACCTIAFDLGIVWDHPYDDIEDSFVLNRFGWLLTALVECPSMALAEKSQQWLESWIAVMGDRKNHSAWESYSVSERLANWPFILLILKELIQLSEEFIQNVTKSMIDHTEYLVSHLELNGEATNNHILNNARGLYIAGLVLNDTFALEKAKQLFLEWTPVMFSNDGVLREHSSHYQFLLCQRYEQVSHLANHVRDDVFYSFMQPWVASMKDVCKLLSVSCARDKTVIPLLGDISPDFTPQWLLPGGGWSILKAGLNWESSNCEAVNTNKVSVQKKGDFIRANAGDITCFWHMATDPYLFLRHGHFDMGGFVLFYRCREIFADPGRYSYTNVGSYGKSAIAHSSITIDSLGAYCEDHRLNSLKAYSQQNSNYKIDEEKDKIVISLDICGFERLRNPAKWVRFFLFMRDRMIIRDEIEATGKSIVMTRFQIDPEVDVEIINNAFELKSGSVSPLIFKIMDNVPYEYVLKRRGNNNDDEEWFSKEYGRRSAGSSLIIRRELNNKQVHEYEIGWAS